jgi:hypothetical protein
MKKSYKEIFDPIEGDITTCNHDFFNHEMIIEYTDDMCEKVFEYGREGNHIEGFCGEYKICHKSFANWLSSPEEKYSKFQSAVNMSISASLAYWHKELKHAISTRNYEVLVHLRAIVDGIMKITPKVLRDKQYENVGDEGAVEKLIKEIQKLKKENNDLVSAMMSR